MTVEEFCNLVLEDVDAAKAEFMELDIDTAGKLWPEVLKNPEVKETLIANTDVDEKFTDFLVEVFASTLKEDQ